MKKTQLLEVTVIFYRSGMIGLSVEVYSFTCSYEDAAKLALKQLQLELKEKSKELFGIESISIRKGSRQ